MAALTHQQLKTLVFEHLRAHDRGQVAEVRAGVLEAAKTKGLIGQRLHEPASVEYLVVEDVLWELFRQGLLYPGLNEQNRYFPWYHLSERGRSAVVSQTVTPYDPDGFISEFQRSNPSVDSVIVDYLSEAVLTFNSDCHRAAAILLGAASEKAILVLVETFEAAITDAARKTKFTKDKGMTIYSNFVALQDRLEAMAAQKKFPGNLAESIIGDLRGAFDLIRRVRNEAGHPAIAGPVDPDTVFLNLRVFSAYVQRIYRFVDFFGKNPADW